MSDNDPAATDHRVGGPPPVPAGSSRRAKRRQQMIVAGAAVVCIAVIGGGAIALFGGDADRSGTVIDDDAARMAAPTTTTTEVAGEDAPPVTEVAGEIAEIEGALITGGGAQQVLRQLGISMPTTASTGPFSVAPGFTVESMQVEIVDATTVSGQAVIAIGSDGLKLATSVTITDADNWSFTVTAAAAPPITLVSGIRIDPSSISGSITKSGGSVDWALTGSTITWVLASNASLTTTFAISNSCPLTTADRCPQGLGDTVYLALVNGALDIGEFPNTISVTGGVAMSGDWARLDGEAGSLTFAGTGISNTILTVWRGPRSDSFDPSMQLPDLSSLSGGTSLEFCGNMSVDIPTLGKTSTGGCARWSPDGVILAQSGGGTVTASLPSTDVSGATIDVPATAEMKGLAWSNLSAGILSNPNLSTVTFAGVSNQLLPKTWTLAGVASLPGVAAEALNVDLRGATSLLFDVRGSFTATSLELEGEVPLSLNIGTEPFKINANSLTARIAAGGGSGVEFSLGTSGIATFGYAPQTRQITSSLTLAAATSPGVGMTISVSAKGIPSSADAGRDGLTAATKLTQPGNTTYIWPDQFGIRGLNLYGLTVEIGFTNGLPELGYNSTAYLDPLGADTRHVIQCSGSCDANDWMISNLLINIGGGTPCFAYGFDGSSGTAGLAISGGVMRAQVFKVGVAPNGCSIQTGSTTTSLPRGFAGFQFTALFGNTTVNVATQTSVNGFEFTAQITNLVLAGMTYPRLELTTQINSSGSRVFFTGQMRSQLGNADVTSELVANASTITQSFDASVTDWALRSAEFTVPRFTFSTSSSFPLDGGCLSMQAAASGQMKVASKTYNLKDASFRLTCNGLQALTLAIDVEHTAKWSGAKMTQYFRLRLVNQSGEKVLTGGTGFAYERRFSRKYKDRTFSRGVKVSFDMNFRMNITNPGTGAFSFLGAFNADRVSGKIGCSFDAGGQDFTCGGELRLNPSWAGIYRATWGDL